MELSLWEKKLVIFFAKPKSKFLDKFSFAISNIMLLIICWIIAAAAILCLDFYTGVVMSLALAIVFVLHFVISEGILKWGAKRFNCERLRPYKAYPKEIKGIGKKFSDSSFPSSHVAAMVGGLVVVLAFYQNFLLPAVLIVLISSWSRLRNGMHYPTDIFAGMVLGLIYGELALKLLSLLIW